MSNVFYAFLAGAAVTFLLRVLPFAVFNHRKMPEKLEYLGHVLPSAIMALLVVYCLKSVKDGGVNAVGQIAGALVTVITYKWKHSTVLSIIAGTAVCMILLRVL